MTDYYAILGVDKTATDAEIKKAYKKLASKYHPDKNKDADAEAKFKEVSDAYEQINTAEKREALANPFAGRFNAGFNPGSFNMFDDVFYRPRKQMYTVRVSLFDAYHGTTINDAKVKANIPPGVRTGMTIHCAEFDLSIVVLPNDKFKRYNDDLLIVANINCFEAMLGATVTLTLLDGKTYSVKMPPGIQQGQTIKMSGKGMPNPEVDKYGDLLIQANITIPSLTETEKDAIIILNKVRPTITI